MHGMIACYKPSQMVSKDVSRWFEKRLGRIKLGHVGTLDPLAEGVLPIMFGRATRLQDYLLEQPKTYEFEVTFGTATTTLDRDGETVDQQPWQHVQADQLTEICQRLEGDFEQIPPLYSAVKFQGKPLYEYAREGRQDEIPWRSLAKQVHIYKLRLIDFSEGNGRFVVTCSKGTYVRVIAAKISEIAGTCGMVSALVRTEAACLGVSECWTLEQLDQLGGDLHRALVPVQKIELNIPKWRALDAGVVDKLRMGQRMQVDMRYFEEGLLRNGAYRAKVRSLDRMLLLDPEGNSFGIGSASVQNTGRIAVVMRRGL
jgi:tRNA pseudouridine55 synthase